MIKRPMIYILLAYLFGLYNAWFGCSYILFSTIILILYFVLYIMAYWLKNELIHKERKYIWFLPIVIIFAFQIMNHTIEKSKIDYIFENGEKCNLTGEVKKIQDKEWGQEIYLKDVCIQFDTEEFKEYKCKGIIVKDSNISDASAYKVGNILQISGNISDISKATNPGQFNLQMYYKAKHINYTVFSNEINILKNKDSGLYSLIHSIKSNLRNTYYSILEPNESGVLLAMLLGDKDLLENDIKILYQDSGISHILAISGLHISLISIAIFTILKLIKIPKYYIIFISISFLYFYYILTNQSISTSRAVVMITVSLLAQILGRTYDMLSGIALSALIILIENPMAVFDTSFLLTFHAVLGIAVLLPALKELINTDIALINTLLVSISVQMMLLPMILLFFYEISLYSLLINLIILPFMSLLVIMALISGIIGCFLKPVAVFLIGISNYILKFYEFVSKIISKLPKNKLVIGKPDNIKIVIYYFVIALFVFLAYRYKKKIMISILLLAVIIVMPNKNDLLEITILDIGQGDAIYMRSREGNTYFIDGGSMDRKGIGFNIIIPFIKSKGESKLDYVILTHLDEDHINGIMDIISYSIEREEKIIKNIILSNPILKDDVYIDFLEFARRAEINILYMSTGDVIRDGELTIECLHPSNDYNSSSKNSYSMVLSVQYYEFSILFTGDLEGEGEKIVQELIENRAKNYYTVLKVAHHGSKNSTSKEFLETIRPKFSFISCGKNNKYGHPHSELISRLEYINSHINITNEKGAITLLTDGYHISIKRFIE